MTEHLTTSGEYAMLAACLLGLMILFLGSIDKNRF
jgi:hypothetical protein